MATSHGIRTFGYGLMMGSLLLAAICCGCSSEPMTGAAYANPSGTSDATRPSTEPTPTGGWWVLYGDDWVYVEGDRPSICHQTVCAAAGGSAIMAYRWDRGFGINKHIRFILL